MRWFWDDYHASQCYSPSARSVAVDECDGQPVRVQASVGSAPVHCTRIGGCECHIACWAAVRAGVAGQVEVVAFVVSPKHREPRAQTVTAAGRRDRRTG